MGFCRTAMREERFARVFGARARKWAWRAQSVLAFLAALSPMLFGLSPAAQAVNVVTYHYDNFRTGWNSKETTLTPASVVGSQFGELFAAEVAGSAAPQPLLATGVWIAGQGAHDVIYVATSRNNVYAIDAISGARLISANLGTPPPRNSFPKRASSGILSTPVLDLNAHLLYVVACTYENSAVVYRLHALDMRTLRDAMPSQVIAASASLSNGSTYYFQASVQKQRPALLEANGNVYVAFGSFGDLAEDVSRGWLLGWNAANLAPLAANHLPNNLASSPGDCWHHGAGPCFLTSIWMSGFGPAADAKGNIYFLTANSDAGSYSPPNNIQESAVKLSGDLSQVLDYFTPSDAKKWDAQDHDFGSGGITLIPEQPGAARDLAVAAGKSGTMYLLNRDRMGQFQGKLRHPDVPQYNVGPCWCGQSYFKGADNIGRVVSSGGDKVEIWKIITSPSNGLNLEVASATLPSGQDPGFLTSVSSNGTAANTAIVWAVVHPQIIPGNVTLFAINPADGSTLLSVPFGRWPHHEQNANLVPVVANGRVYIVVDNYLFAFGLGGGQVKDVAPEMDPRVPSNEIHGTVLAIHGSRIMIATRSGKRLWVAAAGAVATHRSAPIFIGRAIGVDGSYDPWHTLRAKVIFRAKDSPAMWPPDK